MIKINKLRLRNLDNYTSEFESLWAHNSFGLVPHRSKELCKLLYEDVLQVPLHKMK